MSQPNAVGGHPTSFNTNVNRAKTKKWLDAKSYSYDGDDWGDVDDYDEYGGYQEPDPVPRPTGLRQRGQSATQPPQEGYGAGSEVYQSPVDTRQPYNNISGTPPQQQHGGRSTTNPQSQGPPAVLRKNSFDQGDERRAFSAGGPQTGIGNPTTVSNPTPLPQAPHMASQPFQSSPMHPNQQIQAQPDVARPEIHIPARSSMDAQSRHSDQPYSAGSALRGPQFLDQQRQGSRTHSMTSNNSSLDFHGRRDFSPSAMPPPLHTRGSPSPHSNPDSRSSSRHPPRKSSLSQENPPTLPFPTQGPPLTTASDLEEDLPVAREHAGSGAGKPLPFVRPADIYRRMQEEKEKEKERKSQEPSRPSMDSVIVKQNDPPTANKPQEIEPPQRLKPTLEPVSERKSEYGMEGLNINEPMAPEERRPTTSKKFELPNRAPNTSSKPSTSSLPQMLPDVSRISGFGESFFGSAGTSGTGFSDSVLNFAGASSQAPSQEIRQTAPEKDLRNQPSLGFTSAVHQAFDKAEEQVPPTPSSTTGSTVGRSASGGTSAVSPIISRGPSAATERLPGIADVTTPTIAEGHEESNSRPRSSGSPSTLRQYGRGPSPPHGMFSEPAESPPQSFIPGHRRDLSTPSPDNSPARTPAVESIRQLRQPQEVEIAAATPTDAGFSTSSSSQNSEIAQEDHPVRARTRDAPLATSNYQTVGPHVGTNNSPTVADQTRLSTSATHQGRSRTDSSSSNRVRNLADKFESGSRPSSAHSTTPRASLLSNATQKKDEVAPPRPIVDRIESFRPHLPGGWESSVSIAPAPPAKGLESTATRQTPDQVDSSAGFEPSPTTISAQHDDDQSVAHSKPASSVSQIKDAAEEAFTALAAAGSALTGAFAAVGKDNDDSSTESSADKQAFRGQPGDRIPNSRGRSTHSNTVVHPEASRPFLPGMTNDELSSEAPTPLPQNANIGPSATSKDLEYFPPPLSVHNASDTRTKNFREASPAKQQPTLPPLTTDTTPRQYESDRLRKEIVRELTPMSPSEPTTAETDYSNYQSSKVSTSPSLSRPGHESGVIPKEYESYWNDGNSDDELSEAGPEPSRLEHAASTDGQEAAPVNSELLRPVVPKQQTPLPPVPQEQPAEELSQPEDLDPLTHEETVHERPRTLPHRFSWEQPLHDLSAGSVPSQEPPAAPTSDFLNSAIYPEGRSFQPQVGPSENQVTDPMQIGSSVSMNEPPKPPGKYNRIAPSENIPSSQWGQPDGQKDFPIDPPGLEVSPSVGERMHDKPLINGHEDNVSVLAQPTPIGSYDARSDEHPLPELPQQSNLTSTAPNTYPGNYIPPTLPPKIPAFREIVALKTPAERIRGFNDARDQFARLPVGLQGWVDEALRQLPEHEDLLTTSGRLFPSPQGHKSSPSRSKLGGLIPGGGQAGQQAHQQQYLNVSSQPGVFNGPPQSGATSGGSPQAYSPSGGSSGKLSSQQVQAKGKDLLHTAGVFGGKANVAAKELFSKGKSRFRAASGTEKAPNLSSPSLPRGMQQQPPNLRARSATPTRRTLHDGPPTAATEPVTPDIQRSPPSPQQKSPRDSPSLESFTQSQLGDDERSEESVRTSRDQPPRPSTLHANRSSLDVKEEPIVLGATIGDNAPIFLQETPSADSYVGSPNEVHTPRSATSSNKTPTQASFAEKAQLAKAQEKASIRESIERPPKPTSPPLSRFSLPAPLSRNKQGREFASRQDPTSNTSQGLPKEYRDTFQNSGSGRDLRAPNLPSERSPISQKAEPNQQAPEPPFGQREETASYAPLRPLQTSNKYGEYVPPTIPLLAPENTYQAPQSSQNNSQRASNIDVTTDTSNTNRLPSPASQQATIRDLLEQRSRPGPVHYGIDHDFVPRNDQRHVRDRSPSYQGGLEDSAHNSRHSLEPDTSTDSAFWRSDDSRGTERSADYYPEQVPDDSSSVQRPRAEQGRADYVGSPIEGRSESKPRSRRGSRGSAFFKSFGKSPEADEPPLPDTLDVQADHTPVQAPNSRERKGSRASILRSLKRNSGSWGGSGRSKENTMPTTSVPQYPPPAQSYQAAPQQAKDNSPSRGPNSKSKLDKKLQRASTSANLEQESGKKKRFSAIGSLFGRSNPKHQSSVESSPLLTQQRHPAPMQQREVVNAVPPRQSQQYDQGPSIEQPPPEGYYAPPRLDSRHRQSSGGYTQPSSRSQQTGQPMSAQDAPAYIENSSLSQRPSQSATSRTYPQTTTVTQTSTTFSRSPQPPPSSIPQSSTTTRTSTTFSRNSLPPASSSEHPLPSNPRNSRHEPNPRSSGHGSQPSGSSWARFSSHSRSKSRNSQPQVPSTDAFPPASAPPVPSTRSHSPPPPPPPPKDEWHNHRPSHSTASSISTIKSMPPSQAPPPLPPSQPQPYNRPTSTHGTRQALPPLQTDMGGSNRNSAVNRSKKALTPEEKRRSRQQEIERSTMSPQAVAELNTGGRKDSGDEVVMSATSFPGQMWTPDYAHWEGE